MTDLSKRNVVKQFTPRPGVELSVFGSTVPVSNLTKSPSKPKPVQIPQNTKISTTLQRYDCKYPNRLNKTTVAEKKPPFIVSKHKSISDNTLLKAKPIITTVALQSKKIAMTSATSSNTNNSCKDDREIRELKTQLNKQNSELNDLKNMLQKLVLSKENVEKSDIGPSENSVSCQTDRITAFCSKCRTKLTENEWKIGKNSLKLEKEVENRPKESVVRFEEKFSDFPQSHAVQKSDDYSLFESKITAYYDRDQKKSNQNSIRCEAEQNFFEKMIGIAQKWERTQKSNNEECIEQVSLVRRISRSRPDENLPQNYSNQNQNLKSSHWSALTMEAEKNPELKQQLDTLAMQYLSDSQLAKTARNRPKAIDYNKDRAAYHHHNYNSNDENYTKKQKNLTKNEKNFPIEMSLCSREFMKRHGILSDSPEPSENARYDDRNQYRTAPQQRRYENMKPPLKERNMTSPMADRRRYHRNNDWMNEDRNFVNNSNKGDYSSDERDDSFSFSPRV